MIAPGQEARARGRAQRGGVHVVVAQPVGGQRIQMGCVDRTAVAAELTEASVVEDDEQDVWRTPPRPPGRRPCGLGHIKRPADHAGKRLAGFVFLERHLSSLRTEAVTEATPVSRRPAASTW